MRKHLILLALLLILAILNYSVFERESLRRDGELILLELAPVDPRSLMQGDYMDLRYTLAQKANAAWQEIRKTDEGQKAPGDGSGQMVLRLDGQAKASFARFYKKGQTLAENERLISFEFHASGGFNPIRLMPRSFFFQEGHGAAFSQARFGMMRIAENGEHSLIGLADEAGQQIKPE
ncbi:Uncharacterized membrane-anchored protein [Cohaesibacter marisflavi]|uniref:Uncharacterized membrane-anchored protein n=1 Tax=Cohaesibacter marisflavi TaxID=655353 RepID=A0A1I5ESD4_9HYPH|nr:GDYXXLXY domain-containing protein [Cohaesibacter marisflavi]SFO14310.1 Uncharacterized membrane-anchored protein [Cohaesibacter marisflavi]